MTTGYTEERVGAREIREVTYSDVFSRGRSTQRDLENRAKGRWQEEDDKYQRISIALETLLTRSSRRKMLMAAKVGSFGTLRLKGKELIYRVRSLYQDIAQ